ncbi:AaceriAFR612Wp [[Ashbya] aceris (nom. inval.)]|nr:AaceriAFR612Wp [[Ashbya] aceris (nom. inval.)]
MSVASEFHFEQASQRLRSFWSDESIDDAKAATLLAALAKDAAKDFNVWLETLLATAEHTVIDSLESTCTEDFDHPIGALQQIALRARGKLSQLDPLLNEYCGAVLYVETLVYPIRNWWYVRKVPLLVERIFREQAYPKILEDPLLSLNTQTWPDRIPLPPSIPSEQLRRKAIKHIMDEACRAINSHVGRKRYLTWARKATLFLSLVLQSALPDKYGGELVMDIEYKVLLEKHIWERQLLVYMTDDFEDYEQHFLLARSVLTQDELERSWLMKYTEVCDMIAIENRTEVIPAFLRFTTTYAVRSMEVAQHFKSYQYSQPRFVLNLVNYGISNFDRMRLTIKDGTDLDTFLGLTALRTKFVDYFLERFLLKEVIMSDETFSRLATRETELSLRDPSAQGLPLIDWVKQNDRFLQFKKDIELSKDIGDFELGGIEILPKVFNKSLFQVFYCEPESQRMMKIPDYLDRYLNIILEEIRKRTANNKTIVLQPHLHRLVIKADFLTGVYLDIDIWQATVLLEIFSTALEADFDSMINVLEVKNSTAFQGVLNSLRKHKILRKSGKRYILNKEFSPTHPNTEASPYRVTYSRDIVKR